MIVNKIMIQGIKIDSEKSTAASFKLLLIVNRNLAGQHTQILQQCVFECAVDAKY